MQDNTDAHVREMTSYLLCKEYSENYTDKVPFYILKWITDPGSLRFALLKEERNKEAELDLSMILKDLYSSTEFLMRHGKVQLIRRTEGLSTLKISEPFPHKTITHYADLVLRCLTDCLD